MRGSQPSGGTAAALVAAAGLSKRMGTCKATLRLRGEALVHRLARIAISAGAHPCVVTTPPGAEGALVASLLADLDVQVMPNRFYDQGLIGSIRTALDELEPRATSLLVAPVDAPFADLALVQNLLAGAERADAIVVPVVADRPGHPVVFGSDHFEALRSPLADQGAAALLKSRPDCVVRVPSTDQRLVEDLNTPEQARRLGLELE